MERRLIIGVSGASGAPIALGLLKALGECSCAVKYRKNLIDNSPAIP